MAFGGGLDDENEVMNEINMTPLVDVMLVLLIIFILTVPVLTHSVKVDLPRVDNSISNIEPDTIQLTVNAEGNIYWNDTLITNTELETRLLLEANKKPQPDIHIRGDQSVAYKYVVNVMANVQRAGLLKLSFVTEPE
jgi:biopolymer transport protein ExbD